MAETRDTAGADPDLHLQANAFLITLGGAMSQAQLYEPDNRILVAPIDRLGVLLKQLFAHGAVFTFQGRDQSVFVNGQRLRADGPTFLRHQEFLKQLETRQLSGLAISSELGPEPWKTLLFVLARCNRKSASVLAELHSALDAKGLAGKVTLLPRVGTSEGSGDALGLAGDLARRAGGSPNPPGAGPGAPGPAVRLVPETGKKAAARRLKMDRRLFAARAYTKAMLLLREYVRVIEDPARSGHLHLRLQRSVFDLVALCEEDGWKHLGLVNNKRFDEYLYNHSVNVTILSLILGLRLRLSRPRLSELGMAAMLHHLGKARLPKELLEKQGVFTEEEKAKLASHPSLGVREMLRSKQYNEALLKRIMVVAEHHESFKVNADAHPYSRIVAVAETFDALTTDRPYRAGYLPDVAIRILSKLAGDRLDKVLTHAFIQTVGLYPAGTLVELSDQSVAVVFHPHRDAKRWQAPVVRLIKDGAWTDLPQAPILDLSQVPPGGAPLSIVRSLDPAPLGINTTGYLFQEPAGAGGAKRQG